MSWPDRPGVVTFPDGARLRGRGLREAAPEGRPPDFGVYLRGRRPPRTEWPSAWVRWPDFWLPRDGAAAVAAFREAHERALAGEAVEIACRGGRGRTGTALACIARLAGVPAQEAVGWIRRNYDPRAVETRWQRRFVERFEL